MSAHLLSEIERAWLRLHLTPGLGRVGLMRLQQAFGSPLAALAASVEERRRAGLSARVAGAVPAPDDAALLAARRVLEQAGARLVSLWDEEYPPLLAAIHDPPALLYVRGRLPEQNCLAVVGSRRASAAVTRLTEEICKELGEHGISIVSGLARGIDTAAHRGVLAGGAATVAVLGCGIDRIYPPENRQLFQQIGEQGAIISEYAPGTQPLPGHFPARNRIISGLSQGVVVVEAAAGSGSLITADFALEQGREVFALPGPVHAEASRGSNNLLKDGAHLVTEARDILDLLWPGRPSSRTLQQEDRFAHELPVDAARVYATLGPEPLHIDEITQNSGLTPPEVSAILLHLELQGGVQPLPGMRYLRARRS